MLPLELWMQICSLACSDDGHTGRTLSLVSRLFYDASKPYKLRSVAVRGIPQITSFVRYLESLPVERRNVENLYLSTLGTEQSDVDDVFSHSFKALVDLYEPGICDRVAGPDSESILDDGRELLVHAISRVLTSLSPSVRTAHLVLDIYRDFIFFPIKFQHLEELTIQGPFECSYESYIPHLPANPTLRRLKLTYVTLYDDTTLLASIAAFAPHLTYLYYRLSNPYRRETTNRLRKMFSESDPVVDQFPASLQRLYLHPGQREPQGMCGTGYMTVISAQSALLAYCREEPKLVLLKASPSKYESREVWEQKEAEDEWLDRIRGGLGCWDDSKRLV